MKKLILIVLFAALMMNEGSIHDPPPTLIFNWGDIDPNVKIWHNHSVTSRSTLTDSVIAVQGRRVAYINYKNWEPYEK